MRLFVLLVGMMLSCAVYAAESSRVNLICDVVSDPSQRAQCVERASALIGSESTASRREGLPWLSMFWPIGWWVFYYAAGLIIGRYIYRDAKQRDWVFLGIRPVWWAVITLFDPAFGVLVYWAAHYSRLAQSYQEASASPSQPAGDT